MIAEVKRQQRGTGTGWTHTKRLQNECKGESLCVCLQVRACMHTWMNDGCTWALFLSTFSHFCPGFAEQNYGNLTGTGSSKAIRLVNAFQEYCTYELVVEEFT